METILLHQMWLIGKVASDPPPPLLSTTQRLPKDGKFFARVLQVKEKH